jgi:branched-chain amino acid transport system substrate-binding protein
MSKKTLITILVIVLAGLGIYFWTANKQESGPNKPLNIGLIVGSSGPYATVGENYMKGVNLSREQWLKDHPGQEVNLFTEDDAFDQKKGLSAYQKLVSLNHIDALDNMTSATIDAIYTPAKESGIPIALGFEQGIDPVDDNVFQMIPGNVPTETALGQTLKDRGFKKPVVFVDNEITFVRFFNGFKKGYGDGLVEILVNPDTRDYRTHVTKALGENPDALVFLTTPEQGAQMVKIVRTISTKPPQLVFDADVQSGFQDYVRILGDANVLNGSIAVIINQRSNPDFIKAYKEKYGTEPGFAADWGYDSFTLLMRSYAADHPQWIQNMKRASFEGVSGKVEFDEAGVRKPDFNIGSITDGKLTPGK